MASPFTSSESLAKKCSVTSSLKHCFFQRRTRRLARLSITDIEAPPDVVKFFPSEASSFTYSRLQADSDDDIFEDAMEEETQTSATSPRATRSDPRLDLSQYFEGRTVVFRSEHYPGADPNLPYDYINFTRTTSKSMVVSIENRCLARIAKVLPKLIYKKQVTDVDLVDIHFQGALLVTKREKNRGASRYLEIEPIDMQAVAKLIFKVNADGWQYYKSKIGAWGMFSQ